MLPHYSYYIKSHHKAMLLPIFIASIILSFCFINNCSELSFYELFIGNFAIFIVITLNIIFNERVYWIYCVFSEKFYFESGDKK